MKSSVGGKDLFQVICILNGANCPLFAHRRGDVPDLTADPSLAEKDLGFKATQDLDAMCRDLWNWQTKNPFGYLESREGSPKSDESE